MTGRRVGKRRPTEGEHEMNDLGLLALKAVNGGSFVVAFALIGEVLKPKRFAGLFSAAPSVALANLLVIVVAKGHHDAIANSWGMVVGAVAFCLAALAGVPAVRRFRSLPGSVVTCAIWLALAAVAYVGFLR